MMAPCVTARLPGLDAFVIAQSGLVDINTWVEGRLAASDNFMVTGGLLFLGGLLASLLPCVYPLYPITATILRNRADGSPKLLHPSAYFFGLLLVYGSFGVIAAVSGGAFNSVLRWGITNVLISAVFGLLALSTAGWLHLPLFQGREVNARPGLFGTMMLGGAAGMLSSACVGPVVVSLLLRLATADADGPSVVQVASGAGQMLAFGAGVGMPLLCIAVFGVSLPKSGNWMLKVQSLLAIVIGYFAYIYLEKGLAVWEFPDSAAPALASAVIGFLALSYLIQPAETIFETRMRRALCSLGLILTAAVIFRTIQTPAAMVIVSDSSEPAKPIPDVERDGNLSWHLDEAAAYESARLEGKNVFIDFYGAWCTNCKEFEKQTQSDAELNAALGQAVLLKVKDRVPLFQKYKNDPRFPELKIGLPFFVITDPQGNLLYKTNDYLKTEEMILFLSE